MFPSRLPTTTSKSVGVVGGEEIGWATAEAKRAIPLSNIKEPNIMLDVDGDLRR